jgi:hypothetical protein
VHCSAAAPFCTHASRGESAAHASSRQRAREAASFELGRERGAQRRRLAVRGWGCVTQQVDLQQRAHAARLPFSRPSPPRGCVFVHAHHARARPVAAGLRGALVRARRAKHLRAAGTARAGAGGTRGRRCERRDCTPRALRLPRGGGQQCCWQLALVQPAGAAGAQPACAGAVARCASQEHARDRWRIRCGLWQAAVYGPQRCAAQQTR